MYSQNKEDIIVKEYFENQNIKHGFVLDIGANDGVTFSNSRLLIKNGWEGCLLEPSSVFGKLVELYGENDNVCMFNVGIGEHNGIVEFFESGSIIDEQDSNLVSSAVPDERWKQATTFTKKEVPFLDFETFLELHFNDSDTPPVFDFISIDAEGMDWEILSQIDLELHKVSCLCIEWNGNDTLATYFTRYCNDFGLSEIHRNPENIIFAR